MADWIIRILNPDGGESRKIKSARLQQQIAESTQ
jgi:hypothetical protein